MSFHALGGGLLPDNPNEAQLQRILSYADITVPCPFCKAAPGSDCSTPNYSVALSTHAARRKAVAQFSEIEQYRMFAALRAEAVAQRAAVEAVLAKPLSAEQQATRAHIGALFDQHRADSRARESAMMARCRDPWIHNEACHCREGQPYVHPTPKPPVVREVTDLATVRARKAVRA